VVVVLEMGRVDVFAVAICSCMGDGLLEIPELSYSGEKIA
jgi:hypothetical protein